jgi:hypothetical protein
MGASVEHCRKVDEFANDYMGFMTVMPTLDDDADGDDNVWSMF